MAFAEARAVWQRAANRCFVQEDAKRAPKLACCSSLNPSIKEAELGPSGDQEFPSTVFFPFDPEPLCSNSVSRCWLQMQPNFGCYRGLMDGDEKMAYSQESSVDFPSSETDFVMVDQPLSVKEENCRVSYGLDSSFGHKLGIEQNCRKKCEGTFEALVSSNDILFDMDSSWSGSGKSCPWWRTDAEELALLVSEKSLHLVENCDLPLTQKPYARTGLCSNETLFSQYKSFNSSTPQRVSQPPSSNDSTESTIASGISSQKNGLPSESKYGESHGDFPKMARVGEDTAHLLEALRHSQTRARESERAAKEACAEKEHIVKILLRQASHLFAYKQWFKLLQLENTYLQVKRQQGSPFPSVLKQFRAKKHGKSAKRRHVGCDIGKYTIAFAWGFGLVGAGLMLGWGIVWILPSW